MKVSLDRNLKRKRGGLVIQEYAKITFQKQLTTTLSHKQNFQL